MRVCASGAVTYGGRLHTVCLTHVAHHCVLQALSMAGARQLALCALVVACGALLRLAVAYWLAFGEQLGSRAELAPPLDRLELRTPNKPEYR